VAGYKRQHYVPRSYLRRFSTDSEQKQICVGYIAEQRVIEGASIRDQCYRDYYYGEDGTIEEALSKLEGGVAKIFAKLEGDPLYWPSASEREFLILFISTLRGRTEAGELRTASFRQQTEAKLIELYGAETAARALKDINPGIGVVQSLRAHSVVASGLYDLRLICVSAAQDSEFLTCDAPVIHLNMFGFMRRGAPFGVLNSGLVIILPASPSECLIAYDANVYTYAPRGINRIRLDRRSDVFEINRVVSNAAINSIYLRNRTQFCPDVRGLMLHLKNNRPETSVKFELFKEESPNKFQRTTFEDEKGKRGSYLLQHSQPVQKDQLQLSGFRRRLKPVSFDTRTAAGVIRDPAWFRISQDYAESISKKRGNVPTPSKFAKAHPAYQSVGAWKEWLS